MVFKFQICDIVFSSYHTKILYFTFNNLRKRWFSFSCVSAFCVIFNKMFVFCCLKTEFLPGVQHCSYLVFVFAWHIWLIVHN